MEPYGVTGAELAEEPEVGAHDGGDYRIPPDGGVVAEQYDGLAFGRKLDGARHHAARVDTCAQDLQRGLRPEPDTDPVARGVDLPDGRKQTLHRRWRKGVGARHDTQWGSGPRQRRAQAPSAGTSRGAETERVP